jgi:putative phage-type endonuclease
MNAPTREQFLARRQAGIGGSDIAALLGLSKYKTPLQLWMEKTGRGVDEPDEAAQERMHWGVVLEDVVARHYARTRNAQVQRINAQMHHPAVKIAFTNIDRAITVPGRRARWDAELGRVQGAEGILECKTAHALAQNSTDWGDPGTEDVPQAYWMQCQWYLGITRLDVADLAVLFGGQRFVVYTIHRDQQIFDDMLAEADAWWQRHVVADLPPDPSGEDDARRLWKSHVAGRERIVDAQVATAVEDLVAVKEQIKALQDREQALRDAILPVFGDAEAITFAGRRLATWKANKASSKTDWKGLSSRLAAHVDPNLAADLTSMHTTTTEGARVLRLNTKE